MERYIKLYEYEGKLTFTKEMVDSYSGQYNMELGAYIDNNIAGVLEYVEFEKEPSISMIQIIPKYKRQGIGEALIKELAKEYPYKSIVWGIQTKEGTMLKRKMDRLLK